MEVDITTPPLNPAEDFETPAKQDRLPGMEEAAIEEIENAAREYRAAIDRRVSALRKEITLGEVLLTAMDKHGKTTYHRELGDGRVLHVTTTDVKRKVRAKYEDPEEESS